MTPHEEAEQAVNRLAEAYGAYSMTDRQHSFAMICWLEGQKRGIEWTRDTVSAGYDRMIEAL